MIPQKCFHCGTQLEEVTPVDDGDAIIIPGAFNICIKCGAIGIFNKEHIIVEATPVQIQELEREDPYVYAQMQVAQAIIQSRIQLN